VSSRLVNVRLDDERLRKVQRLRARGIALSDVVREAIDERFLRLQSKSQPDVPALVRRIFEQYPDPSELPARDDDIHDPRVLRDVVRRRLAAKRR
jgi:hypothetical protein